MLHSAWQIGVVTPAALLGILCEGIRWRGAAASNCQPAGGCAMVGHYQNISALMGRFLLTALIAAKLLSYHHENITHHGVTVTAIISCVPRDPFSAEKGGAWFRRMWTHGKCNSCARSCIHSNESQTQTCETGKHSARLEIQSIETTDRGVYYCVPHCASIRLSGSGRGPDAGDPGTFSSAHLLGPPETPLTKNTVQLACGVPEARHTVHITWKIAGTPAKGNMIFREAPGGTWTFLNLIKLPRDTWNCGQSVICEIWFNSSHVRIRWQMPEEGAVAVRTVPDCNVCMVPVMLLALLVSIIYLLWSYNYYEAPASDIFRTLIGQLRFQPCIRTCLFGTTPGQVCSHAVTNTGVSVSGCNVI